MKNCWPMRRRRGARNLALGATCATALLAFAAPAQAQWSVPDSREKPSTTPHLVQVFPQAEWDASTQAPPEVVDRYEDMRFGLMVSFGITVYGKAELSWGTVPENQRKVPDGTALSDGKTFADADWVHWDRHLTLEKFNAREWVSFAKASGFRYIVLLAKHHEGFHFWDTAYSDYKVTNTPFGRDFLKEIIDECHRQRLAVGIYYSQRDWYRPDYQPTGFGPDGAQPGPQHPQYIEYQRNVVRELMTRYGKIDIFWWDAAWWGGMYKPADWDSENLVRMIRKLQPGIIINNRASVPGDFDTPEQRMGVFQTWRPWEAAVSLEDTWSYTGANPKSSDQVIRLLVKTATTNGNLDLSLGPKWSGEFAPEEKAIMLRVGSWLSLFGESIYATRGGPWLPSAWGGATWRGSTAWLHVTDLPEDNLTLPSVPGNRVIRAERLVKDANGRLARQRLAVIERDGQIRIALPLGQRDPLDTVIRLAMARSLAGVTPQPGGSAIHTDAHLDPFAYELVFGKRQVAGVTMRTSDANRAPGQPAVEHLLGGAGGSHAIAASSGAQSWIQFDLGTSKSVTALLLEASASGRQIAVSVSEDGQNFEPVWNSATVKTQGPWEIEVSKMKAGALLPGRTARFIRIEAQTGGDAPVVIQRLGIWAKD